MGSKQIRVCDQCSDEIKSFPLRLFLVVEVRDEWGRREQTQPDGGAEVCGDQCAHELLSGLIAALRAQAHPAPPPLREVPAF